MAADSEQVCRLAACAVQWYDALLTWAPPAVLPPHKHIAIVAAGKVAAYSL